MSSPPLDPKAFSIVLVEDHKLTRICTEMILSENPALNVVGVGESGLQAVELVRRLKPDLIMVDLGLPDLDGLEVLDSIRNLNLNTRIIVLTSHQTDDAVLRALSGGADGFCLKDMLSGNLAAVVKSVCEGQSFIDPRAACIALQFFHRDGSDAGKTTACFMSANALFHGESAGNFESDDLPSFLEVDPLFEVLTTDTDFMALMVQDVCDQNAHELLTRQERQVIDCAVGKMSNPTIASTLNVSLNQIEHHIGSICNKLNHFAVAKTFPEN